MAHAQKPDFVFRRNGWIYLNRRGRQFSRLLAAELCASVVVMLDTPCSEVVWRVLATHSIRQFPLHFPSRASPCTITFQLDSITLFNSINCWLPIAAIEARGSKCGAGDRLFREKIFIIFLKFFRPDSRKMSQTRPRPTFNIFSKLLITNNVTIQRYKVSAKIIVVK